MYAINAGAEDVLQIEWVFFAGNTFEQQNLLAASTNFLIKNGTKSKTAFQLNEHFEYYGSYLNRNCFNETAVVSLHSLSKHLKELLPVVREMLTEATFPQDEIDTYKQNMKQRLRVNLKKCDFVAGRLIDTYLYGEQHPYGRYSRFEDFDAIDRQQLVDFYQRYYQNGRFVVFVAGRLPADIFPLLNQHFGDLPVQKMDVPKIASVQAAEKNTV